jgi:hypothetical protein
VTDVPDAPGGEDNGSADRDGDDEAPTSRLKARPVDPDEAIIDEASEESFPASDSPSSWAGPPSESR